MTRFFDRLAEMIAHAAARPLFFVFCVALVVVWAPSIFVLGNVDTWQLIINTATTIITFLLVALLQNSQSRSERAMHHKLDALAEAVAEVLDNTDGLDRAGSRADELRRMAGVELEPS